MKLFAYFSIAFGLVLAGAETLINWGYWQFWPFFVVDYVAALIVLVGGMQYLRDECKKGALITLTAGWTFSVGMSWMSLAGNVEKYMQAVDSTARHDTVGGLGVYVGLVVLLFSVSVFGAVVSFLAARKEGRT